VSVQVVLQHFVADCVAIFVLPIVLPVLLEAIVCQMYVVVPVVQLIVI
jgi:hypothetical protein